MLIYWALFVAFTAGTVMTQADETRRWALFVLVASIPTILMIGLRWKIGPDWIAYVEIYKYTKLFSFTQAVLHVDPGFFLLQWGLGRMGAPFWVLNFVCGLVFVAGLTAFCQRQSNAWLAFLLAFPYLVIVIGMSGLRQSLALGFLFYALNAFEDRRLYRVTIFTLAGALFHSSAILMLPIFLFSYDQKLVQRVAVLCLIAIIFVYEFQSAFNVYMVRYSSLRIQSGGLVYRLAMNGIAAGAFLLFTRKLAFPRHLNRLWLNFSLCTLALIPLALAVPSSTAIDRFLLYLFPLQFAVLSRLPRALVPERNPSLVTVAVIAYAAAVQVIFLSFGTYASYYVPYRSIFDV